MNAEVSIDVDYMEQIPAKTSLRLIQIAQTAQKNLQLFKETLRQRSPLFRRLEELDIDVAFQADQGWINVQFTGDGDRLGKVWGEFRRNGWSTCSRPEKGKTEFYAFWHQDGFADLFMNFTSSVCKRVKIGTKTVEQDVYEIQCGELPVLESEDKPVAVVEEVDDFAF